MGTEDVLTGSKFVSVQHPDQEFFFQTGDSYRKKHNESAGFGDYDQLREKDSFDNLKVNKKSKKPGLMASDYTDQPVMGNQRDI